MSRLRFIVFLSFLLILGGCKDNPTEVGMAKRKIPAPPIKRMSQMQYGIETDSMQVIRTTLKRNQVLTDVLGEHNVDYSTIGQIATESKKVFDVRKWKAGNSITIMKAEDEKVDYFIYEKNKAEYLVFDLREQKAVEVHAGKKKIRLEERESSGVILSSLYQTISANDLHMDLCYELEELYAWSLDFFHTQKGDYFKVIYDERFVDGESIGVSKIKGAIFHHGDRDYYAIGFEQDSLLDFFDESGNSLRKAFLKAPLRYSRISSGYTARRFHPILKRYKSHLGVDYAAPTGTPIRAIGDGVVIAARYSKGNGRFVKVRHNSVYTTQYLHMSKFAKGLKSGKSVQQGDVIGYVGSTGLATGPHLCFRFWKNGVQVNPRKIESPATKPIADHSKLAYESVKTTLMDRLHKLPLVIPAEDPAGELSLSSK